MTDDPAILFVKPLAIGKTDKRTLQKAGVIVIEVEDPNAIKFVRAHAEISSNALLGAAAKVIKEARYGAAEIQAAFARAVCALLESTKP